MEVTITQVELRKIFNVYNKTCTYYNMRTDVRQYGTEENTSLFYPSMTLTFYLQNTFFRVRKELL